MCLPALRDRFRGRLALPMKTSYFDYDLPPELIAQQPASDRAGARMMIIIRSTGEIRHGRVADLPRLLNPGDLLVVNNTRVIPARLFGRKEASGGAVEILLVEETAKNTWESLIRCSNVPAPGRWLSLASGRVRAEVLAHGDGGRITLRLEHEGNLFSIMEEEGVPPLPPYIRRPRTGSSRDDPAGAAADKNRYQTVYARIPGAVAAPTAGLHFTRGLLADLKSAGVRRTAITLHVGPGTFKPVKTELVENHRMEEERYSVPPAAARMITDARRAGGRIIAVGSTVVRTLETVASDDAIVKPGRGRSALFIVPPYTFRTVDAMLTNFHLPRSTLLMMVSAFAGLELTRRAYRAAARERYRFYSYGDCMLIL